MRFVLFSTPLRNAVISKNNLWSPLFFISFILHIYNIKYFIISQVKNRDQLSEIFVHFYY